MHEIESKGTEAVLAKLYNDQTVWSSVLKDIASGNKSWLRVATALRSVSDAGASEMLDLAVGEALEHDPINVFRIALKVFPIRYICTAPDYDDPRYSSYELAMKAINLRIHKVVSMRMKESTVDECIQYLEAAKKEVAHFYEVNK